MCANSCILVINTVQRDSQGSFYFSVCPHPTQDTTLVATTKAVPLSNAVTKTTPAPSGKDQSNTSPQSPSQWSSGKHVTDTAVPTTNATPIG